MCDVINKRSEESKRTYIIGNSDSTINGSYHSGYFIIRGEGDNKEFVFELYTPISSLPSCFILNGETIRDLKIQDLVV